jgi:hypothetical protein
MRTFFFAIVLMSIIMIVIVHGGAPRIHSLHGMLANVPRTVRWGRRAVCGRPHECKQNLIRSWTCGRALSCVRPQNAASHAAGPYGSAKIRSITLTRAQGASARTGFPDLVLSTVCP